MKRQTVAPSTGRGDPMKLSEVVHRVIELAGKVREYYDTELPKRHPNYPLIGPDDVTAPPPPEEGELRDFFSTLPVEQIYLLRSLMDLGRMGFKANDLAKNYDAWADSSSDPAYAAVEMLHNVPLADQLLDGLEELHKHRIDLDELPLKKAKWRKR